MNKKEITLEITEEFESNRNKFTQEYPEKKDLINEHCFNSIKNFDSNIFYRKHIFFKDNPVQGQ